MLRNAEIYSNSHSQDNQPLQVHTDCLCVCVCVRVCVCVCVCEVPAAKYPLYLQKMKDSPTWESWREQNELLGAASVKEAQCKLVDSVPKVLGCPNESWGGPRPQVVMSFISVCISFEPLVLWSISQFNVFLSKNWCLVCQCRGSGKVGWSGVLCTDSLACPILFFSIREVYRALTGTVNHRWEGQR